MTTGEKLTWLYANTHTLYLTCNVHRSNYRTVSEHLDHEGELIDPDDLVGTLGDTLIELHIYPTTPIGSYYWYGSDLDLVIHTAYALLAPYVLVSA